MVLRSVKLCSRGKVELLNFHSKYSCVLVLTAYRTTRVLTTINYTTKKLSVYKTSQVNKTKRRKTKLNVRFMLELRLPRPVRVMKNNFYIYYVFK